MCGELHLAKEEDDVKYKTPLRNMKGMKVFRKMKGTEAPKKKRNPNKKKRTWWHSIIILSDNEKVNQDNLV